VFRWGSILGALGVLGLLFYFSAVTTLWGYYSYKRAIPDVHWFDIAVPTRFSHVQEAISRFYLSQAKEAWAKHDVVRAVVTARASLVKSPGNLEARLFLAECWREAGRYDESVQTLRQGIPYSAADPRLQNAVINLCLASSHYADLIAVLHTDFPAQGVHLLDGPNRAIQLADVRAILETSGAGEAAAAVASHPGLADQPEAAALMARIDSESGHPDRALELLRAAHLRAPRDVGLQAAFITTALDMGKADEARTASEQFIKDFPTLLTAQLAFLNAHGSRQGRDEKPWTEIMLLVLAENWHKPEALAELASVAASSGWTDVTLLLYENSLEENLTGFPFAIYYAASLVRAGDLTGADAVLRELSIRNGAQLSSAGYLTAMIDWGTGRESEALQVIQRLRRETADDLRRRRIMAGVFRTFGFPKVADQLEAKGS
jgi:tetratricopeptide (TPR) repeat protein